MLLIVILCVNFRQLLIVFIVYLSMRTKYLSDMKLTMYRTHCLWIFLHGESVATFRNKMGFASDKKIESKLHIPNRLNVFDEIT